MADDKSVSQSSGVTSTGADTPGTNIGSSSGSSVLTTHAATPLKGWKIAEAREVKPEKPDVEPLDHIYVGYTLAKIFAGILAGYLVLALVSITYSECRTMEKMDALTQGLSPNQIKTSTTQTNEVTREEIDALTKSVAEAYRDTRAATIEFHKTVIINVLFPILTALLGYIFANRGKNFPEKNGK